MVLGIVLVLAGIILVFLAVVSFQSDQFKVSRSALISAPDSVVFARVNDFHQWADWSPWEKLDPDMKKTFEGPSSGMGAVYRWAGNQKIGEGSMAITESRPDLIKLRLDFLKPFAATNEVEFTFKVEGKQTNVSWSMSGRKNFMFKAVHLFINMDKMIGGEYEKGLATLKSLSEAGTK